MGPMKWLMETRIENQVVPSRQAGTMEKGRTPESWREVFCGRWPFPWTGGADQEKIAEWPMSGALPSTLRERSARAV